MSEVGGLPLASDAGAAGFDAARLDHMAAWMADMVGTGQVAGASTLLMRHGQVVDFRTFGKARLGDQAPLAADTMFRIYSMTKPVTAVAMMILFEEGRWRLDDPITKFLPEFEGQKVFAGMDADGSMRLEDATRPPSMRELMSHTAGLGYGLFDVHPVERAYGEKAVLSAGSLDELARRAADIPLMFQPGTEWFYSVASDLLGLIVERLSGQTLGAFLQDRIFGPLRMADTGFHTRADNEHRLAGLYADDGAGGLKTATHTFGVPIHDITTRPPFEGGGGGLVSTTTDYARFCQMILNRGELDGVRILSPETVALMGTNVIPDAVLDTTNPLRLLPFSRAFGFGLGFSIVLDPTALGVSEGRGTLSWGGGGGTWFWVDPASDIAFVGMIQRMADPVSDTFRRTARTFVYRALTHPEK
ncbi:CubicO group peptidase (beta-lactamase class C family) [Brevundimonas alba]|uniref:CubicO group peptidase (Beta-lactamase class C family) n=1 Tax=Brevundimonas alba TaxID=74314 RepID=A0A7X5YHF8_9CAUL|nr:serine hydrolase domain-containing protein [Brevundimonas alba]NJC39808.1 CubicO group peptidase (beta-lactamase class C family) [Brevundimonas alba]